MLNLQHVIHRRINNVIETPFLCVDGVHENLCSISANIYKIERFLTTGAKLCQSL